jgi:hypothetical protein
LTQDVGENCWLVLSNNMGLHELGKNWTFGIDEVFEVLIKVFVRFTRNNHHVKPEILFGAFRCLLLSLSINLLLSNFIRFEVLLNGM